jgi:hypothetical protein
MQRAGWLLGIPANAARYVPRFIIIRPLRDLPNSRLIETWRSANDKHRKREHPIMLKVSKINGEEDRDILRRPFFMA